MNTHTILDMILERDKLPERQASAKLTEIEDAIEELLRDVIKQTKEATQQELYEEEYPI